MTSTMNLAHVQGANGELEFQQVLNTLMFPNVNVGSYSAMDGWRRYDKKSISIHEAFTLERFLENVSYVFEYLDKLH